VGCYNGGQISVYCRGFIAAGSSAEQDAACRVGQAAEGARACESGHRRSPALGRISPPAGHSLAPLHHDYGEDGRVSARSGRSAAGAAGVARRGCGRGRKTGHGGRAARARLLKSATGEGGRNPIWSSLVARTGAASSMGRAAGPGAIAGAASGSINRRMSDGRLSAGIRLATSRTRCTTASRSARSEGNPKPVAGCRSSALIRWSALCNNWSSPSSPSY
jgi:hypothetical protein